MTTMEMSLTRPDLERWILDFAHQIIEQHVVLSDLDAASGDADHGSNMERGMSALLQSVPGWDSTALPGEFLKQVGLHIVSSVGGSSGALYGTIFLRMARTVGDAPSINAGLLSDAFEAAAQGVVERGNVKQGDKTMYDALAPSVQALRAQLTAKKSPSEALQSAAAAAEAGRDATADMVARKGKSSYAREKSRGFIDPGATSVAMLIRSAARTLG
ncbi:dihydroxyacetone kinase subunit DhaL [Pseudarthrobacter sp. HLT3-5]|uniref:dihydroxyacetone kinase subunit DhaL n=1 Tax=Pseudarthrobacter cellobiosi TaxID=2953654 RepID=UPI00208E2430|nr:dihydroxyacetone kinase subunit DhaL [Pseudarthrobacter sp. HLT3-5]MCO4273305.1 dihydroxyacetone kinase subunit DhaL [Pseudarthrobacter sp. HLT3-5]